MAKEQVRRWVGWNDLTMFGDFGIDHLQQTLSGPSQQTQRQILTDLARANVPVAIISGATDLEQRARTLGAVATLAKPIDVDHLMGVVRRYCA